jgi:hypothetical protein
MHVQQNVKKDMLWFKEIQIVITEFAIFIPGA